MLYFFAVIPYFWCFKAILRVGSLSYLYFVAGVIYENSMRIFDITPFENDWTKRGAWVQATLWVLTKDMIRKVRFFTATSINSRSNINVE